MMEFYSHRAKVYDRRSVSYLRQVPKNALGAGQLKAPKRHPVHVS